MRNLYNSRIVKIGIFAPPAGWRKPQLHHALCASRYDASLMILKALIAILGMAAVGWITWRLVNKQGEPAGLDDSLDGHAAPPKSQAGAIDRSASEQ